MKKMIKRSRKFFAAVAIAATASAVVAGATLSGQTREAPSVNEICATVEWPNIPAECLIGASNTEFRMIGLGQAAPTTALAMGGMSERFAVAFE
jgi:hypothetical protein